ncbi:LysR family transcriptional regulator [Ideonella livida]|uniref:LysR family transcriptional regulator n=1 Tax=Ideonella livida TaxID=2707176 RepID=A0A7C9TL99_9BURK|nr:LysR substrate-binding domain-containing protein [Ideonella livida]NDY92442.1 LysR family transcriptional regulator [Ideonella livida]
MDTAAWKLFLDAADLGSLSKTATAYRTTQPHISRQIGALEAACGGRLFQRTGRGVALTELGQRVAPQVRAWLASTEQLMADIRQASGEPIGTVRLGMLPSTAHLVAQLVQALRQQHPQVRLAVREGQGAQLETWLEEGSVDLALLYRQRASQAEDDVVLVDTATCLVGPAGDPLTAGPTVPFDALRGLPLVHFCRPNRWRDHLDDLARAHGFALNVVLEADSLALQTRLVAAGGLWALLGPYAVATAREPDLQAARLVQPEVPRPIVLALSRHGAHTLASKAVMRLLQQTARAGVGAAVPPGP